MLWNIDPKQPMPIYAQLADLVRRAVATGGLGAGDRLPTVRQMAVDLKINPNTVARAYSELERAGIIATRQGRGTFVLDSQADGPHERDSDQLNELAERTMLEAQRLGFQLDELIDSLRSLEATAVLPTQEAS